MASPEVRALIVAERLDGRQKTCRATGCQRDRHVERTRTARSGSEPRPIPFRLAAPRRFQSARSILLALLAFVTCAPLRNVARANAMSLSTQADFETRGKDAPELGPSTTKAAYNRQTNDAPPACELETLEPEGPEDDASLDLPAVSRGTCVAAIRSSAGQVPRVALTGWMAQFWLSSAQPRGPPPTRL